jgi:quercetin dioxygenase-like cupin family protein
MTPSATARHLVRTAADAEFSTLSPGHRRWSAVDESAAVHTGFGVCELDPGSAVAAHVHSFEESFYLLEGTVVLTTAEGSFRLGEGDFGVLPVGVPHSWRNDGDSAARWADMLAPQPRSRHDGDTYAVPPLREEPASPLSVRDPRTRRFGHIAAEQMDPFTKNATSVSMNTALLVYSGITVKMMVDSDLGAQLSTMFMVQYTPDGVAGPHDHPFEESYLILAGRTEATFDGEKFLLGPGDIAWAGVGCVHSFTNAGDEPVRWLETQAPQPPARHSYRFARDWEPMRDRGLPGS